jgi:hypothetical protein
MKRSSLEVKRDILNLAKNEIGRTDLLLKARISNMKLLDGWLKELKEEGFIQELSAVKAAFPLLYPSVKRRSSTFISSGDITDHPINTNLFIS